MFVDVVLVDISVMYRSGKAITIANYRSQYKNDIRNNDHNRNAAYYALINKFISIILQLLQRKLFIYLQLDFNFHALFI